MTSLPPDSRTEKSAVVILFTFPLNVILPEVVTVPERVKPFTVPVPETDVTVPVPGETVEDNVPPENDNPDPIVTLLNPPALFP